MIIFLGLCNAVKMYVINIGLMGPLLDFQKKRLSKPKAPIEMGTQNSDIDYSWIPKETLMAMSEYHSLFYTKLLDFTA